MAGIQGLGVPPQPMQPVGPVGQIGQTAPPSANFKDMLLDSVQQVNAMQLDANKAVEELMIGGDANPAEVLSAVQKADLAFRMVMQVRNKLVAAYNEIKDLRI